MLRFNKAQIISESFKYLLVGIFSVAILVAGYVFFNAVSQRECQTEVTEFEIDLRNIDKAIRPGTAEAVTFDAPCGVDKIYFFDLNNKANPEVFRGIPIIKDSLEAGSNNIFLVKGMDVKRSFYAGNFEIDEPHYICLKPTANKISILLERTGKSVKLTRLGNQPECT